MMMRIIFRILIFIVLLVVLFVLVYKGYDYSWTGFARQNVESDIKPDKTLWDWLDLLIVPLVLAVGAYLLEGSRKRTERDVENDRQKQHILDDYFAYISKLLLDHGLSESCASDLARKLARTRTLAALRLLDAKRKAQLLQFLYEANLINLEPVIQLNGADFREAVLDEATLSHAELRGVYFSKASIRYATLVGADLRGSDFSEVNFDASNLTDARLAQARLDGADLRKATLCNTDLSEIKLDDVKMTEQQRAEAEAKLHKET